MNTLRRTSYDMFTKSAIPDLFKRHSVNLNPVQYIAAAHVFPMRVNSHLTGSLIDWSNVPDDPSFQLAFPQPCMLDVEDLELMCKAIQASLPKPEIQKLADRIRGKLNPHPAHKKEENVTKENGNDLPRMQHKYRETVLFFPSEGQYCHAFCTYCFRWAQLPRSVLLRLSNLAIRINYIATSRRTLKSKMFCLLAVTMVMSASALRAYIDPLIAKATRPSNLETIRIGSKSLSWWPYRYIGGQASKAILDLFAEVVSSGRQLAFQAHFSHPRELEHPATQEAIRLIRMTGAQIRAQAPPIRHVNDDAAVWRGLWNLEGRLGIIPYYMFVERDTGASHYFSVPLAKALRIYNSAYSGLAGTARTVRGPSMSASPGKVGIIGEEVIAGERVFVLKFFQARNPARIGRIFFAQHDPHAVWLDDLRPAFGEKKFFFEEDYRKLVSRVNEGSSGQIQRLLHGDV